jgi:hypothetical protein
MARGPVMSLAGANNLSTLHLLTAVGHLSYRQKKPVEGKKNGKQ